MATSRNKKPSDWTFLEALSEMVDNPTSRNQPAKRGNHRSRQEAPEKKAISETVDRNPPAKRGNHRSRQGAPEEKAPSRNMSGTERRGGDTSLQEAPAKKSPEPQAMMTMRDIDEAPKGDETDHSAEDSFSAAIESSLAKMNTIADSGRRNIEATSRMENIAEATKRGFDADKRFAEAEAENEAPDMEASEAESRFSDASRDQTAEKRFAEAEDENKGALRDADAEKRFAEAEAEIAAPDEATLLKDFETTHGGAFDPNSSKDATKFQEIKDFRRKNPKATPAQIALMVYRNKK
jgi:hypothetical protein